MSGPKYLLLNLSPRKGNTWKVAQLTQDAILAVQPEAVFQEISLAESGLPFCIGCSLCFREGHACCPHHDRVQPILDAMEEADGWIFAAACYQGTIPGIAKNFTDHLAYLIHRPRYFTKKALHISTTGGVSAGTVTKSMAATVAGWGVNRSYPLPLTAFSWNDWQPREKDLRRIRKTARAFAEDVASGTLHPAKLAPMIPFNLFRAFGMFYTEDSAYPTEDGVFWQSRQNLLYGEGIPVPVPKALMARRIHALARKLAPRTEITYRK